MYYLIKHPICRYLLISRQVLFVNLYLNIRWIRKPLNTEWYQFASEIRLLPRLDCTVVGGVSCCRRLGLSSSSSWRTTLLRWPWWPRWETPPHPLPRPRWAEFPRSRFLPIGCRCNRRLRTLWCLFFDPWSSTNVLTKFWQLAWFLERELNRSDGEESERVKYL